MRLAHQEIDYQSNVVGQQFTVEMNSMLFHSIINGIYADKIKSPIRELMTNAYDAHAAAGKRDVPFQIKLPTVEDPTFQVRDFGPSMTHEEILGRYSTMFASSKRDDNEAVGMIGLGSKSPFAYTSTFYITAWQNGEARTYIVAMGEEGVPQIAMVDLRDSEEPTGFMVGMAVEANDIGLFHSRFKAVLIGFDVKPTVLNEEFTPGWDEIIEPGEGWNIYTSLPATRAFARQGCVLYPINMNLLHSRFSHSILASIPIVIDFEIGQLSVSTSREELGYDPSTIANLEARLDVVIADILRSMNERLSGMASYFDACRWVYDTINRWDNSNLRNRVLTFRDQLHWKDQKIRTDFRLNGGSSLEVRYFDSDHPWFGDVVKAPRLFSVRNSVSFHVRVAMRVIVYYALGTDPLASQMRRVFAEAKTQNRPIIWLRCPDKDTLTQALEALGNPEHVALSTVTPLTVKAVKNPFVFFRALRVGADRLHSVQISTQEESNWVYITGQAGNIDLLGMHLGSNFNRWYQGVKERFPNAPTKLLYLNEPDLKRIAKQANIKTIGLKDWILAEFKKRYNLPDFIQRSSVIIDGSTDYSFRNLVELAEGWGGPIPEEITNVVEFKRKHDQQKNFKSNSSDYYLIKQLFPELHRAHQKTGSFNQQQEELTKLVHTKFPLLSCCTDTQSFNHYMELITK